jgi:hypothetical protein
VATELDAGQQQMDKGATGKIGTAVNIRNRRLEALGTPNSLITRTPSAKFPWYVAYSDFEAAP